MGSEKRGKSGIRTGGKKRISAKNDGGRKDKTPAPKSVIPIAEEPIFSLRDAAFDKQLRFIEDPARLKALFCTRRAAKSYTGGLYIAEEALKYPNSNLLFIALTRETAKGIIWKDILKEINLKFKIGMVFNGTTLTATLPNGSVIWVTGADADEDEMNKLLGKKYRLVVVDEASMFSINMRQLVYGVLKPATADQRGTICLLGTASNLTRGLFYDITTGREQGWSLHTWTAFDNPHVAKQWQEELDDIRLNRPSFQKEPLYRQWYLNEWVIDTAALIYKFQRLKNELFHPLPQFEVPYRYVLGVFLGHAPDPSGIIVAAYNEMSPFLFITSAKKYPNLDTYGVAQRIKEFEKDFNFEVKVIKGLSRATVEEMNVRYSSHVVHSDMLEKDEEHWINLFNSELNQQRIFFMRDAEEIKEEMETLVWEVDGNGLVKKPRKAVKVIPNQLSNAILSLWHYTHSYLYASPIGKKQDEDWEKKHIQKLIDQARREENPHHLDAEFLPPEELFDFDKDEML